MKYSRTHVLATHFTLLAILALVISAPEIKTNVKSEEQTILTGFNTAKAFARMDYFAEQKVPDTMTYRTAKRMQRRLRKFQGASASLFDLAKAIEYRQELLKKKIHLTFETIENPLYQELDVALSAHPTWIEPIVRMTSVEFSLSKDQILQYFQFDALGSLEQPIDVTLSEIYPYSTDDIQIEKAKTNDVAKGGYILSEEGIEKIIGALKASTESLTVELTHVPGKVINQTERDLGKLELIATGRSNFKGSTWARTFNVKKALNEHVNNTLVAPGETFSFNSTLGGPVTLGRGWTMAKVIFNGNELRPSPGGGICQASTTVFRAVLNAGFPVVERRSHSLYVSYYEEYGVGIDATIFPGTQDLTFLNDSNNYLLIQSYEEGYDAIVNIYGTPDGRQVAIDGPFFTESAPENLRHNERELRKNEIGWLQQVRYPDGRLVENTIVSQYQTIPLYVRRKYTEEEQKQNSLFMASAVQ